MSDYISELKSPCCNSEWYVKSRSNWRCKKCDKDITIDIMLMVQAEEEFNQVPKQ